MTSVGIVGGLGPESTIDYYRRILETWERDDPSSVPSIVIDSLDVQRALRLVATDLPALTEYLLASLRRLAGAGVDFIAMTANTPHIVFDDLAARSPVPLLSIVEVCAEDARRRGRHRLALLGTRFTMEAPFYPTVFARRGIAVVTPNDADRAWIHDRYIGELLRGEFRDETRRGFVSLVERLRDEHGVDGLILGGTELPLLLPAPVIAGLPALDTTALHVAAIVERLRRPGPPPAGVTIRAMRPGEESLVAALALRSFRASIAPACSAEGVAEFERIAAAEQLAARSGKDHDILVAEDGGGLSGMIEVRQHRHVAMLFVDPGAQRRGVGRSLLEAAISACQGASPELRQVTVNATPNSLEAYRRLAFAATGDEQTSRGLRFVPMVRRVQARPYA